VNTFRVVVADIVAKESAQVILIEHDDVINDFSLARSHPAFGRSVLPWTVKCGAPGLYAETSDRFPDVVGEDGVLVADQILGS
jgi:hypothetical protein